MKHILSTPIFITVTLLFLIATTTHAATNGIPIFGRVTSVSDGQPIEGDGAFKTNICDANGNLTYSNDGSSSSTCAEPSGSFTVSNITNGYFSFTLGDTTLSGDMASLATNVLLTSPGSYLHIWFREDATQAFEKIGVMEIASVPNAVNAELLNGVPASTFLTSDSNLAAEHIDGVIAASQVAAFSSDVRTMTLGDSASTSDVAILANTASSSNKPSIRYEATLGEWQVSNDGVNYSAIPTSTALANGSVTADTIATGVVDSDKILDHTIASVDLATSSVGSDAIAASSVTSSEMVASGVTAGTYNLASITVDEDGRVTNASSGAVLADITAVGDITTGDAFTETTGNDGTTLYFEGTTSDDKETALTSADPTVDVTLTLPAVTGTLISSADVGTVTGTMIDESTLSLTGLVQNTDLQTDAVDSSKILDDSVAASDIASDAVGSSEIATNSVNSSEIVASGVTAGTYNLASITVDEDGRVTNASSGAILADITAVGDVTTGDAFTQTTGNDGTTLYFEGTTSDDKEIALTSADPTADATLTLPAVTGTLISSADVGSVTSTMVTDASLVDADLSSSAAISFSKLAALNEAQILVGNSSNVASAVAISGDATITAGGVLTIAANSIDGSNISLSSETRGDVLYYNGSDWARLAAGTSGQVLITGGSSADPSWSASGTGGMPHEVLNRRFGIRHPLTTAATTFTAVGMSAPTSPSGTATAQTAATGAARLYIRYASAATINSIGGLAGGPFSETRPLYRPKYSTIVLTDSAVTSRRIYAGIAESSLASLATNTSSTTASGIDYVAIGYDTAGTGDTTNWLCCSGDGTNSSCSSVGVAVAASTEYTLTVDWTVSGQLTCTVNGTSVTKTSNLSTAAVNLGTYNAMTTLTAAARNHFIAKDALEQN